MHFIYIVLHVYNIYLSISYNALDNGKTFLAIFLDLAKANTVNHDELITSLPSFGYKVTSTK